jgi:hypothetical protein
VDELEVTSIKEGVRLRVHVQPRASRAKVQGVHDGALKVAITAPPVDGEANAALIKLLAKHFGVARSTVSLVAGERSRNKTVELRGITVADLR